MRLFTASTLAPAVKRTFAVSKTSERIKIYTQRFLVGKKIKSGTIDNTQ